jgi:hypothetical protein
MPIQRQANCWSSRQGVVESLVTPKVTLPEPVQVDSLVPGGGIGIDVRGCFQNPLQIRIGSDGKR